MKTNTMRDDACSLINSSVSVKRILEFGWGWYVENHAVREIEAKEVEKTLNCYSYENGPFVYICKDCGKYVFMRLGCNSRLCSCCGKRYADQWAKSLSKAMFQIPHRHFVISIPDALWSFLKEDRSLWKVYMDSAIATCNDYFPKIMRARGARVGVIVIFHPFAKDIQFQPHLHLIITEGGFDKAGRFIKQEFVPARNFAKCWQYHVLKALQKHGLPKRLASEMYERYDGFYVWVHKDGRIHHPKLIAKYLGRYVRHPAIANSRITSFDGSDISFYYEDREKQRHNATMSLEEFISALIQHIPERQFKMIRYYGAYARGTKKLFKAYLLSSIAQLKLCRFGFKRPKKELRCPYCKGELEFVWFLGKPPPEELKSQRELAEWFSENFKN